MITNANDKDTDTILTNLGILTLDAYERHRKIANDVAKKVKNLTNNNDTSLIGNILRKEAAKL